MEKGRPIISTDPLAPLAEPEGADEADTGAEAELRAFTIPADLHGQRLDRALAVLVPEFSRSYLQQLLAAGAVRIGETTATKASRKVGAGERGAVELRATPQSQAFVPQPMALQVVHEDAHILVIDKPAGLVVHPAAGNWSGTLLNGLLARDPCFSRMPRAGIVHRLDKDTSGLMVVARTRQAMDKLVEMIAARDVSRQYIALAHRVWEGPRKREVDAPIGRDPRNRLRMAVVDLQRNAGKPARTTFELLAQAAQGCLVGAALHTGRTHQIRVHMASIGHPLVSDPLYGGAPAAGMQRQALHAARLAFAHPATGEAMHFAAPLPRDFTDALAAWGLRYNESQWLTSQAHGTDDPS